MSQYLSVALNVRGRPCLVVGAGSVASRRAAALIEAGAAVTVVAPRVGGEIERLSNLSALTLHRRGFQPTDLDGVFLAVAATNDPSVNRLVTMLAHQQGVLVNSAEDPNSGDLAFPSIVRRGSIQIAISTDGQVPALARHLRKRIEETIPEEYAGLLELLSRLRQELRGQGARIDAELWQQAIDEDLVELIREGRVQEASDLARSRLHGT